MAHSYFFLNFFQLVITYHVPFILEYLHFLIFYLFFWVKLHIIPIFLPNFLIFDNFDLIFGPSLLFSNFFSTDNDLSCLLYFRLPSFYNFLCIFFSQNAYNTNFYQIFSILLIFDNFHQIFGPPLLFFPIFFNWW